MIRFRSWISHNGSAIKDIIRNRINRERRVDAPVAMTKVLIAVKFDANFERFAEAVGGEMAETYFLRTIQFAADHDGFLGSIRVPRDRFGAVVLSRQWHQCSRARGEKVYDALLSSSICIPCAEGDFEAEMQKLSADKIPDRSTDKSGKLSVSASASASASASNLPPSPLPGGESSPSAAEPQDDPPARHADLRPRERERFAKVVEYAIECGTLAERDEALVLRQRIRNSDVTDFEMAELLSGKFAWVTRERLARSMEGPTKTPPKPTPPPASPTVTPRNPVCKRHQRPLPCGTCEIADKAAELRAKNATKPPEPPLPPTIG